MHHKYFSRRLLRNIQLIHFFKIQIQHIDKHKKIAVLILGHPACGITSLALWSSLTLPNGRSTGICTIKIHCSVGLRSRDTGNPKRFHRQVPQHSFLKQETRLCKSVPGGWLSLMTLHYSPDVKLVTDAVQTRAPLSCWLVLHRQDFLWLLSLSGVLEKVP